MSGESENVDSTAGERNAPTSGLVAKNGGTDPPAAFNPGAPIASTHDNLARIVHRELEKMERGEIEVLSEQHNSMLQQLASLSISSTSRIVNHPVQAKQLKPCPPCPICSYVCMQKCCPHQRL